MSTDLLKNLSAEIQKSLPAMASKELLEFIEQANKDKETLVALNNQVASYKSLIDKREEQLKELDTEYKMLKARVISEQDLEKGWKDFRLEQEKAESTKLKCELEYSKASSKNLYDLMWVVFKNTEVKRSVCTTTPLIRAYNNENVESHNWASYETITHE